MNLKSSLFFFLSQKKSELSVKCTLLSQLPFYLNKAPVCSDSVDLLTGATSVGQLL